MENIIAVKKYGLAQRIVVGSYSALKSSGFFVYNHIGRSGQNIPMNTLVYAPV